VNETYFRWEPVPDVSAPCADIVLHADPGDVTVRLRFSQMRDAAPRDLLVRFGREVAACMSHDEFLHPWQADETAGEVPRLGGAWGRYAHPLLLVHGSRWLASFSDGQLVDYQHLTLTHYRFVSLDNTVDVLATGDATAEWVPPAP
jgi:hypothetical protein